jgi:hypothetical protein
MSQPRDPYQGGPGYGPYRGEPGRPYQQPYGAPPPQQRPPQQRYAPPPPRERYTPPPAPSRSFRLPGLGLLLTGLGLVIQVLSLTVLPWILVGGQDPLSVSIPDLYDVASQVGTHGFGQWYVILFSAPAAALGILLALASVLNSVALKVIWACLALAGLGFLVLRYGFWPVLDGFDFTTQEITTAVIALVALVVVIFALKMALSMFRRVAGLILLALAAVHVAAVVDLVKGGSIADLGIGAWGPAVGYVLTAVAAFIGPRKLPGV